MIQYEDFRHSCLNDHDWPHTFAPDLEKFSEAAREHIIQQNYELLKQIDHPYFMVH